ncbi:hypothetical protein I0C86_21505, partial [Plantactinospora sp. S1510]
PPSRTAPEGTEQLPAEVEVVAVPEEARPGAHSWQPYVTGTVSEVRLPCRHSEIAQPANLGLAWDGIAAWLAARG